MYQENQQNSSDSCHFEDKRESSKFTASTKEAGDVCNFLPDEYSQLDFRPDLFQKTPEGKSISQKVHQKSVSWIITICWSKDLSQECLWQTLLLFYAFKAQKQVSKQNLELILLSCLSLALKMTTSRVYHLEDLSKLASRRIEVPEIVCMEAEICEVVDFNLVIPHQLESLELWDSFTEDQFQQLLFLSEILLLKDHTIFVDNQKLNELIKLVLDKEMGRLLKLHDQISQLLKLKECRIIVSKYSSQIDVSKLQEEFI